MYLVISITFVLCLVSVNANQLFNRNEKLAQPSLIHDFSSSQSAIDDTDYWDHDDFVPYKADRHDTFDWGLLKKVLLTEYNNIILSPFSVKLLLILLTEAAGQETQTQRELASILPNLKSPLLVRELFRKKLDSLKDENSGSQIKIGTKIFVDNYVEPRQRFASIVKDAFDTDIESVNFRKVSEATGIINNWCKNVTEGYIDNLVSEDDIHNSILLMLNAIYFNGQWRHQFALNETITLPFFVTKTNQVRADYMTQTNNFYYFKSSQFNAKIIRLPYKDKKFSMTILLPEPDVPLDNLIRDFDGDKLKRLQWLMDLTMVKVTLPKLKFDYTSHLKQSLQELGITEIFGQNASLPLLARGSVLNSQLKVSNVIQKSGLILDEKGTIAFAATEVTLTNKFGSSKLQEFNANRPFAFFIEDESTGIVLFAGKVVNPSK